MNRLLKELLILAMGIGFGIIVHGSYEAWNYTEPEPIVITEYREIEAEPEVITEVVYVPYIPETPLNLSVHEIRPANADPG